MAPSLSAKDMKGKYTSVQDFSVDNRGNKGQMVTEGTQFMRRFDSGRENIYLVSKQGKIFTVARNKITIKGRTAIGASLTNRTIELVL